MSLLVDLTTNAIDQGYVEAANRRATAPVEPGTSKLGRSRRTATLLVAVVLGLAGALFATSAVATHRGADAAKRDRKQLIAQIDDLTSRTDRARQSLDALRASVQSARSAALNATGRGSQLQAEIDQLDVVTGGRAVAGPGLEVRLDDADGADVSGSLGMIYDRDIQAVVDALFASGAEAIAVNGQRLTTLTAIREAGQAILVDYRPLTAPYLIDAIGPPDLRDRFSSTQTASLYRNWHQVYGLGFRVTTHERLTLPSAANQVVHYAQPLGNQ